MSLLTCAKSSPIITTNVSTVNVTNIVIKKEEKIDLQRFLRKQVANRDLEGGRMWTEIYYNDTSAFTNDEN